MKTREILSGVFSGGLLILAGAAVSGCGESGNTALDPPLLEGPEAVQAVRTALQPGEKVLYGPGRDQASWDPPMFIVDGQVVDDEAMRLLDGRPDLLQSIRVFKGEKAVSRFGSEGENGVIEITLKEPLRGLVTPVDSSG